MSAAAIEPTANGFKTDLGEKAIAELSQKKAVLAKFREGYKGLHCNDRDGYDATHAAIQTLVKVRTSTDKRRLEHGESARKWIAEVNATAKEIISTAEEIEKPLRAMRDAVDEAVEREKQAKIEAERQRLADIENARLAEEAARVKAQQDAENERLRIEGLRLVEEAEKNRIEREKIEAFRTKVQAEKDAQAAAAKTETERIATEAKAAADRIAEAAQAARDKIEADRIAHEKFQADERAKLIEEQRELERQKAEVARVERLRLEAIELERVTKEREERIAREKSEQEAEAARLAEADAARKEAMKPDREKLVKFAGQIEALAKKAQPA